MTLLLFFHSCLSYQFKVVTTSVFLRVSFNINEYWFLLECSFYTEMNMFWYENLNLRHTLFRQWPSLHSWNIQLGCKILSVLFSTLQNLVLWCYLVYFHLFSYLDETNHISYWFVIYFSTVPFWFCYWRLISSIKLNGLVILYFSIKVTISFSFKISQSFIIFLWFEGSCISFSIIIFNSHLD